MNKLIPALLALGLITGCGNQAEKQAAEETAVPELIADIAAGKSASIVCGSCHGDNGISNVVDTPHLAGQPTEYLLNAMLAYQNGDRIHEIMQIALSKLGEQDLINLAGYYASLTPPDTSTNPEPVPVGLVKETIETESEDQSAIAPAAAASCSGCHGATGVSAIPGTPSLASLSKEYLVIATKAYRTQERQDPLMAGMVAALSDEDIDALAEYYAAQPLESTSTAASGDISAGQAASASCAGCHGADGNSSNPAANPSLSAQDAAYLVKAIKAYKDNTRSNAIMPGMVAALSDKDIEDISAFYASKSRTSPVEASAEEAPREPMAAAEWAEKCDRCHGPNGVSELPSHPRLANQRADYLAKALAAYQNGERKSSAMHKMSMPLLEAEIQDIANHYSKR